MQQRHQGRQNVKPGPSRFDPGPPRFAERPSFLKSCSLWSFATRWAEQKDAERTSQGRRRALRELAAVLDPREERTWYFIGVTL
jgi:hypothetical protein